MQIAHGWHTNKQVLKPQRVNHIFALLSLIMGSNPNLSDELLWTELHLNIRLIVFRLHRIRVRVRVYMNASPFCILNKIISLDRANGLIDAYG